ncbi:MAG: hypothetical protein ACR2KO_04495 [Geodermatophilaceae bacterium]
MSLLMVGLLVLAVVMLPDSTDPKAPAVIAGGSPTLLVPHPKMQAPKIDAQRVHRELHAVGRVCPPDGGDRTARVRPRVEAILESRRYPNVSFPIDDETGTTVRLLILTRFSLRTCAPELADRVNHALPSRYQTSGPSD